MKSAIERAIEFLDAHGLGAGHVALGLSFMEHARDQRHLCAEAVNYSGVGLYDARAVADAAHAAAMNAPAPGEKQ